MPIVDTMSDQGTPHPSSQPSREKLALAGAIGLLVAAALALSYELAALLPDQSLPPGVVRVDSTESQPKTLSSYSFAFLDKPAELPEIHFADGNGRSLTLRDFRGRPVLLNIWATWCVPCRKEMPSLDRLQAKFNPSKFLVLTLSIDHRDVSAVKGFYQELGIRSLGIYVDRSGAVLTDVGGPGLPTTLLINADGQEIGRKIGPAEWDSPETVALLRQHLNLPPEAPTAGAPG